MAKHSHLKAVWDSGLNIAVGSTAGAPAEHDHIIIADIFKNNTTRPAWARFFSYNLKILYFSCRHRQSIAVLCIVYNQSATDHSHLSIVRKSLIFLCFIPSRLISSSSIETTYLGKLSRTDSYTPNSRLIVSSEASIYVTCTYNF